jgi:hypothetical protein
MMDRKWIPTEARKDTTKPRSRARSLGLAPFHGAHFAKRVKPAPQKPGRSEIPPNVSLRFESLNSSQSRRSHLARFVACELASSRATVLVVRHANVLVVRDTRATLESEST